MHLSKHLHHACRLLALLIVLYPLSLPFAPTMSTATDHDIMSITDCAGTTDPSSCSDDAPSCSQHCSAMLNDIPSPLNLADALHAPERIRSSIAAIEERLRPPIG